MYDYRKDQIQDKVRTLPHTYTPLRYPGGKTHVHEQINAIIQQNSLQSRTYVEPFAGGGGLALKLLIKNNVERIHLNDSDPAIAAFWKTCLTDPGYLVNRLQETEVSLEQWKIQRQIYENQQDFRNKEIAFSTLFLNRTNRSGVMTAGVNGGQEQAGNIKIDARFTSVTRKNLANKIIAISKLSSKITFTENDASDLVKDLTSARDQWFVFADPPYIKKGPALYKNSYTETDHRSFGKILRESDLSYIVSYDKHPLARQIYMENEARILDTRYSISIKSNSSEYLFFSKDITPPYNMKEI